MRAEPACSCRGSPDPVLALRTWNFATRTLRRISRHPLNWAFAAWQNQGAIRRPAVWLGDCVRSSAQSATKKIPRIRIMRIMAEAHVKFAALQNGKKRAGRRTYFSPEKMVVTLVLRRAL